MYFAIYQAIAKDEHRPGLYREYPPDFFDLIIVDECHRGSARDESNWREILEYFQPAYQLGHDGHAPQRDDNVDTYRLLRQPHLHVQPAAGHRGRLPGPLPGPPDHHHLRCRRLAARRQGELDRYGREIPDEEYQTKDFERVVALRARTKAIARTSPTS